MVIGKFENTIPSRGSCFLCGCRGILLYKALNDNLFGASGRWSFKRCSNEKCGLIWIDPVPSKKILAEAYVDYYTHSNDNGNKSCFYRISSKIRDGYLQKKLGYRRGVGRRWYSILSPLAYLYPAGPGKFESLAMYLRAPQSGAKLLEIGCGSGKLLLGMLKMGWNVEGIDTDPISVMTAQSRGLNVIRGELRAQYQLQEHFDAIYMGHVIEHLYEPLTLLQECERILKYNGRIVIVTPNTESWGSKHFQQSWRGLEPPRHLHLFNQDNFCKLTKKAGFLCERIFTTGKGAGYILGQSLSLKRRKSEALNTESRIGNILTPKTTIKFFEFFERCLIHIDHRAGEELVYIGRKAKK